MSPQLRNVKVAIDLRDFSVPDYGKIRGAFEAMKRDQNSPCHNLCPSYSLNLRSICLEYFSLPIIWSGLTSLTFTSRAADFEILEEPLDAALMIGALLQHCPNLEHCDFNLPPVLRGDEEPLALDDDTPDSVISLPRLKTLRIRQISNVPLGFAKALHLPELRELTLTCNPWEPSPRGRQASSLVEFIERFGPSLTAATIHYVDLTRKALHECLKHLPNVSVLRLTGERGITVGDCATLSAAVLEKLSGVVAEGKSPLCPKLESFHCGLGPSDCLEVEPLMAFIASRRLKLSNLPGGSDNSHSVDRTYLRDMRVRTHADHGQERVDIVEELRQQGVIDAEGLSFTSSSWSLYTPPWLDYDHGGDEDQRSRDDPSLFF